MTRYIVFPGDPLDGAPVEVIPGKGEYPWVRGADGVAFVWRPEKLRGPTAQESQLVLPGVVRT